MDCEITLPNPTVNFIPARSPLNWDEYFMLQAMLAAFKSKDPTTKVGCVFADENNHQISMGYNGFVAGIDESQLPWGKDPRVGLEFQKYGYVVHAEANAILQTDSSLTGTRCYATLFPCHECAKLLASKKVSEVIYCSDKHKEAESFRISRKIFDLAGIRYRHLPIKAELRKKLEEHLDSMLETLE